MHRPCLRIPVNTHDRVRGIDLSHSFYRPPGLKGIARKVLGKDVSLIRREVMSAAFERNPYSGVMATDNTGEAIGFFEAWSIVEEKLDALLRGSIRDEDLEATDFETLDRSFNKIYVGMTVPLVRADGRRISDEFASETLHALLFGASRLFERVYSPREKAHGNLQLFALPATDDGKKLAVDLGFQVDARSRKRKDKKLVYHREVTKAWVSQLRRSYNLNSDRFEITESWPRPNSRVTKRHLASVDGEPSVHVELGSAVGVHVLPNQGRHSADIHGG